MAILVLVLAACGTHERPVVDGLGTAVSAATGTVPPVLRDPLEIPQASIVRGDDVGYLPGEGQVTADGAFTYTIPLDVPPGLGVTPGLALRYSSRGGNGPVGRGWSVAGSSSVIARCDATIATEGRADGVDYDASDSYCLDGKKLVLVEGSEQRVEYRTEDDEMSRILGLGGASAGGPGAFEVSTKDGRIRIYEETYATRVVASSEAERSARVVTPIWLLSRELDRSGNEIQYLYEKHIASGPPYSHEFLIQTIAYGPGSSPRRKIVFEYEDRPDPSISYKSGVRWRSTRRLKKISMWAPNPGATQKVWEYTLDYELGQLGRSLLSSVQKCGHEGTCLWPKRLHWVHEDPLQFASGLVLPISGVVTSLRVFDVNGDGKDDILRAIDVPRPPAVPRPTAGLPHPHVPPEPPDELYLSVSQPGSEVSFRTVRVNPAGSPLENTNLKHSRPIDANGDGRVELLAYDTETCLYRLVKWSDTKEAFVATRTTVSAGTQFYCTGKFSAPPPALELVDLNGDALLDVVIAFAPSPFESFWSIQLNEGGRFGERIETGVRAARGRCPGPVGGDFDGDGRGELVVGEVVVGEEVVGDKITCQGGVAIGLDDAGEVTAPPAFPLEREGAPVALADINGDGLSDALWVHPGSVELSVNTGNGLGPAVPLSGSGVGASGYVHVSATVRTPRGAGGGMAGWAREARRDALPVRGPADGPARARSARVRADDRVEQRVARGAGHHLRPCDAGGHDLSLRGAPAVDPGGHADPTPRPAGRTRLRAADRRIVHARGGPREREGAGGPPGARLPGRAAQRRSQLFRCHARGGATRVRGPGGEHRLERGGAHALRGRGRPRRRGADPAERDVRGRRLWQPEEGNRSDRGRRAPRGDEDVRRAA